MSTFTSPEKSQNKAVEHGEIKVLLVEDNEDLRLSIREFLEMHGFPVTVSRDGLDAELIATARAFEVIISDIRLPGLDGITLTKHLRVGARPPQVILITAYPHWKNIKGAYAAGAYDVMTKPLSLYQLLVTVDEAAARKRVDDEKNRHPRQGLEGLEG